MFTRGNSLTLWRNTRWCMEGPTHHFALGIGHHADTVAKVAASFGIESVIVTR